MTLPPVHASLIWQCRGHTNDLAARAREPHMAVLRANDLTGHICALSAATVRMVEFTGRESRRRVATVCANNFRSRECAPFVSTATVRANERIADRR